MKRRPKEAWAQTDATWKSELLFGSVSGVLSILILAFTGWPESPVISAVIPIGATIGAAAVLPLAQFFWQLIWQPWNDMKTKVADLAENDHMAEPERLVVVLRNYLRQGFELDSYRHRGAESYSSSELDELEEWTHNVVTCLTEYGTKAQCEKFIEADKSCSTGFAAHRKWTLARIAALEAIIKELDGERS